VRWVVIARIYDFPIVSADEASFTPGQFARIIGVHIKRNQRKVEMVVVIDERIGIVNSRSPGSITADTHLHVIEIDGHKSGADECQSCAY